MDFDHQSWGAGRWREWPVTEGCLSKAGAVAGGRGGEILTWGSLQCQAKAIGSGEPFLINISWLDFRKRILPLLLWERAATDIYWALTLCLAGRHL